MTDRYPDCYDPPDPILGYLGRFGWVSAAWEHAGPPANRDTIPAAVFDRLEGFIEDEDSAYIRTYAGRIAAMDALAKAAAANPN